MTPRLIQLFSVLSYFLLWWLNLYQGLKANLDLKPRALQIFFELKSSIDDFNISI